MKFIFLLIFLAACSIAPLNSPHTANTLGKDKNEIIATPFMAPRFSYGRGVTENLDLSISLETQVGIQASLWSKYAFINNRQGFSLAGVFSVFQTFDAAESSGFTTGPIFSRRWNWFEPYFLTRYNYVHWNEVKVKNDVGKYDFFDFTTPKTDFHYFQSTLGFNFWFSETFDLNLNVTYFHSGNLFFENKGATLGGVDLIWNY